MSKHFNLMDAIYAIEQRKFNCVANAALAEIVGLVDRAGVTGYRCFDRSWMMSFTCSIHRINGSKIRTKRILIYQTVSLTDFSWWRRKVWPERIVRLKVRYARDRKMGFCGWLIELLATNVSDSEIEQLHHQQRGTNIIEDPVLGTFVFDKGDDQYRAIVDWCGQPGRLYLDAKSPAAARRALKTAHALWKDQRHWRRRINKAILDGLFKLKNDGWLIDGENPVGAKEFLNRTTLDSMTVRADGTFHIYYADGGLFYDHSIFVEGSLRKGVKPADIVG